MSSARKPTLPKTTRPPVSQALFFDHPLAQWLFHRLLILTWLPFILSSFVLVAMWVKLDHTLDAPSLGPALDDELTFEMVGFMLGRDDQDNWFETVDNFWWGTNYEVSGGDVILQRPIGLICESYSGETQLRVRQSSEAVWQTIPAACHAREDQASASNQWNSFANRVLYTGIWLNVTILLPGTLLWVLIVVLFRRYARRVPVLLSELAATGSLKPGQMTLDIFLTNLTSDLDRWWSQASGLLALAALVFVSLATGALPALVRNMTDLGFKLDARGFESWFTLSYAPVVIPFVIFLVMAVRHIIVVTGYVRRLPHDLTLDIRPQHPDRCGGVKRLGDLSVQMAWMFLLPSVLMTFWYQSGILERVPLALTYAVIGGFIVLVMLATMGFIWPIWAIHRAMVAHRAAVQDATMAELNRIDSQLRALLESPDGIPAAAAPIDALKSRRELVLLLNPIDQPAPSWPVDTAIWVRFLTPQVLSLLFLIAGLEETSLLNTLFEALRQLLGS